MSTPKTDSKNSTSSSARRQPGANPQKKKKRAKQQPKMSERFALALLAGQSYAYSFLSFGRMLLAFVLLASGLFILGALAVYSFSAEQVYSMVHSQTIDASEQPLVGIEGAQIGYHLFNGLFGWASFVFSGLLLVAGIGFLWLRRSEWPRLLLRVLQILLWTMWGALALATLQWLIGGEDSVLAWGGELGELYRSSVVQSFGSLGLVLTIVLSLLIILMLCSQRVLEILGTRPAFIDAERQRPAFSWNPFRKKAQPEQEEGDEEQAYEEDDDEEDDDEYEDSEEEDDEEPSEQDDTISAPLADTPARTAITVPLADEDDTMEVEVATSDDLVEVEEESGYTPGFLLAHYQKPSTELLKDYGPASVDIDREEIEQTKKQIIHTLASFKIQVIPSKATVGPTVTLYEVVPEQGVKVSRITGLVDDLALALKSEGIRIIAPMPGQGTVGIEVPNRKPQTVSMRSIMASRRFKDELEKMELPIGIGKTITNEPFIFDLSKMPHLLIAGATGQGKSVGLNALITSLLYSKRPEELKFVMVDPKMLEFSLYEELEKHFMAKLPDTEKAIITDMSLVVPTLNSLCVEMENRYELLTRAKVRNIKEYNEHVREGRLSRLEGFDFLPYIVLIVDEFADLILTRGKEVEQPINRLAAKARAAGIHMVIATQRPSTDVITGLIKANFPGRIAFKVFAGHDSRTILDSYGANQLIGRGDMLFYQGKEMVRVQCAFLDTPETQDIVRHISGQESFGHAYELPEYVSDEGTAEAKDLNLDKKDKLFEEAARLVVSMQVGSASVIQRKMEVGFARAGRIVDQLEGAGILGPQRGSKPREILIQDLQSLEELLDRLR